MRRVVTISQTTGALREDVAVAVAQRLGFRRVDEQIVEAAAERQGLDPSIVGNVEKRRSFMQALREALDSGADADIAAVAYGGVAYVPQHSWDRTRRDYPPLLREVIRDVIRETAEQGDVVIGSHAGSVALPSGPELLRVLVTASPETRTRRTVETDEIDEREAKKRIEESDAGRADYLRRFYEIEDELTTHYDLVVNTEVLTTDEVVELIVAAASR